jgi:hypothetical protein
MPWNSVESELPSSDPETGPTVRVVPPPARRPASRNELLDVPLLYLDGNHWTIRDAVEGTQVFGGNGSGKTSGSGRTIASAFVRHGFGGLVLTAKPDDLYQWVANLEAAGLSPTEIVDRVVVVQTPESPPCQIKTPKGHTLTLPECRAFNFLAYEFDRCGKLTNDIVSLFINALSPGSAAVSSSDPFWDEALRELLTHSVDLAALTSEAEEGTPRVRLSQVLDIIDSAPKDLSQAASLSWRDPARSACWKGIRKVADTLVKDKRLTPGRLADFSRNLDFWTSRFPALSDRTRSVVVSSLTAKASGLLHSPIRELLCGDDDGVSSNAQPEVTFHGKIVILNVPVKLYGEVGRFAQTIWKTVWQRAVERRVKVIDEDPEQRPVFLWADEAQYFITREDAGFQQTARSSMAATVYLTQNISNYYAALPAASAKATTDSLVGNLQTKIFHANGDPATNEWAERLFGKTVRSMASSSATFSHQSDSVGQGRSASMMSVVEAQHFARLRTGGPGKKYCVDAWVYKAGLPWEQSTATMLKLGYKEVPPHILHCTFHQGVL